MPVDASVAGAEGFANRAARLDDGAEICFISTRALSFRPVRKARSGGCVIRGAGMT